MGFRPHLKNAVEQKQTSLRVFAFDVGFDERCVRESRLGVVDVGIGGVVKQNNGFVLGNHPHSCDQLLEFILKHPFVATQVNLLAVFDVTQ